QPSACGAMQSRKQRGTVCGLRFRSRSPLRPRIQCRGSDGCSQELELELELELDQKWTFAESTEAGELLAILWQSQRDSGIILPRRYSTRDRNSSFRT